MYCHTQNHPCLDPNFIEVCYKRYMYSWTSPYRLRHWLGAEKVPILNNDDSFRGGVWPGLGVLKSLLVNGHLPTRLLIDHMLCWPIISHVRKRLLSNRDIYGKVSHWRQPQYGNRLPTIGDVTRVLWRHASQTSRLFIQLVQTNHCLTCEGNPPVTGGFPSQIASHGESVVML